MQSGGQRSGQFGLSVQLETGIDQTDVCNYETNVGRNLRIRKWPARNTRTAEREADAATLYSPAARHPAAEGARGSAPDRRQLYLGRLYAYKTTLKIKVHAASPRHQLAVQLFRFVSDEAAASAGSMSLPTFIACTSVVCAKWTAPTRRPCSSTPAPSATVNWGNWSNFNGAVAAPRFRSNIVALK